MKDSFLISKQIANSTRFLRLPGSTQALYFHMNGDADDLGIVEVLATMRKTNAVEQDLLTLISSGLITLLDKNDLICYINNYSLTNSNRDIRYVKISQYLRLLAEKLPDERIMLAKINEEGKKSRVWCSAEEAMQEIPKLLR